MRKTGTGTDPSSSLQPTASDTGCTSKKPSWLVQAPLGAQPTSKGAWRATTFYADFSASLGSKSMWDGEPLAPLTRTSSPSCQPEAHPAGKAPRTGPHHLPCPGVTAQLRRLSAPHAAPASQQELLPCARPATTRSGDFSAGQKAREHRAALGHTRWGALPRSVTGKRPVCTRSPLPLCHCPSSPSTPLRAHHGHSTAHSRAPVSGH